MSSVAVMVCGWLLGAGVVCPVSLETLGRRLEALPDQTTTGHWGDMPHPLLACPLIRWIC